MPKVSRAMAPMITRAFTSDMPMDDEALELEESESP